MNPNNRLAEAGCGMEVEKRGRALKGSSIRVLVGILVPLLLVAGGCSTDVRPSVDAATVRSGGDLEGNAELMGRCRRLAREFQVRFEHTASVDGMPILIEWYHAQLAELMKEYRPARVNNDMILECHTDHELNAPVRLMLKTETQKHNAPDGMPGDTDWKVGVRDEKARW